MANHGLGQYRPLPGVKDEMMTNEGAIRPLWKRLMTRLESLSADDMARDIARADQYLMNSGVFYRQYGDGQSLERPWPLSHIPVLIEEAEWAKLSEGLMQRADLLEKLMADFYGPNDLVQSGRLPTSLIAGNSEWQRPMVGVQPRSGHYLHFIAFELGRGPNGQWWVLSDRTQAPSGAGFALENRVATSRMYADIYSAENVHRLAGFFGGFRDALMALRQDRNGRVAVMTPGPLNETYYEQAYIARYLGVSLVQGEDLAVSGGQLMMRTVSGLRPVEVLWRRLDSNYADPLELDHKSRIGTPGMVSALRAGSLTMVNALGSGLLETRALMAFLPSLAKDLLGERLAIPNIATWWCGDAAARQAVLNAPGRMVLNPALASGLPFDPATPHVNAGNMPPEELARLLAELGPTLVAQEAVTLSTTPTLIDGAIVPRPMALRVFLARTPMGWQVMPGGYARIGATPDPAAIAMQRGGSAADVWVVSPRKVSDVTLVAPASQPLRRAEPGALPSRSAENLFWLGRYVERSEGVLRLLRAYNIRLAETGNAESPLLRALTPLFEWHGIDPSKGIPNGLLVNLDAAIGSAGRVRDRFSPDAWSALTDLDKTARRMATRVTPGDDAARALSKLLRKLAGISGLMHENMYRFMGWRFMTIGRLHERATGMAQTLSILTQPDAPDGLLDLAIEVGDSTLTHRRRFTVTTSRETVLDLLALDPLNPRSIRHQIDQLREQVDRLPAANTQGDLSPLARAVLRIYADLAVSEPRDLTPERLTDLRNRIASLSTNLSEAYLQ